MSDTTILNPNIAVDLTESAERLKGWEGVTITRHIDAGADAYSLTIPWDPTAENRERFRPFKATQIRLKHNEETILTGYIEKVAPSGSGADRVLNIQGRSATGVLIDWSAGPPFEFQGMTFNQIARQVAGIDYTGGRTQYSVYATPDTNVLDDVAIDVGQTVYDFLGSLAQANGLWAQPQANGALKFSRISSTQASVVDLSEGQSPVIAVSGDYDVTVRHQRYMVISQNEGDPEAEYEISDPETLGIGVRGRKIIELAQESADIQQAAIMARSHALIDSCRLSVTVVGWRNGTSLWTPGRIIRLKAPSAFVDRLTRLMIQRVTLTLDETGGEIATLDLALPEAYDQLTPQDLPWVG